MALHVVTGKQVLEHALQLLKIDQVSADLLQREVSCVGQILICIHEASFQCLVPKTLVAFYRLA